MAKTMPRSERCCICLEALLPYGDPCTTTPCGHPFHTACLDRWLEERNSCAVCRSIVTDHDRYVDATYTTRVAGVDGREVAITMEMQFDTSVDGAIVTMDVAETGDVCFDATLTTDFRMFLVDTQLQVEGVLLRNRLQHILAEEPRITKDCVEHVYLLVVYAWYKYLMFGDVLPP